MLSQYNPNTALYFGHRFANYIDEGYMAGGGYVLSRKALSKFGDKLIYNQTLCWVLSDANEDLSMGRCLAHSAIFVDCRDEMHQKRFFPIGMIDHAAKPISMTYDWYANTLYYNVTEENLGCCSDTSVGFHYQGPKIIHLLEYYIYGVDIFGLDIYKNEKLPPKLSLEEIIAASDYHSLAKNYKNHTDYHDIETSEKY
jgi:glycoprotein-N-acetylgalactosamine 3-beta-galactosyltransferase